ncbi:PAS domain-containing sensor histidine kinase [Leptospira langatensis]|uniref:histidine kinase n=1 Tax=Leptospira langatensis TaxID=2484983 RepID=A0A5F1ZUE7_9LEPT|nr:PAS domain-containing hybrid sensor histidine kinase/response regulator [Leptospira langatensis]TGJ98834.1 PAS domain-containing sensor histidine kinase [Leptospira langatensis]TGL40599.1 PAS domain-containing sensor histidine kinase [Leptospira langatensis]
MPETPSDLLTFIQFFANSNVNAIYLTHVIRDKDGKLFDWTLEYCNELGSKMMGIPLQDLLGKSYRQLSPGAMEKNPELLQFMDSVSKAGSEWRGIRSSIISGKFYDATLLCPKDDWIISIAKDLHQELKEKDIFREAAMQSHDPLYYLEPVFSDTGGIEDFLYTDLNPAAEEELRLKREAVLGHSLCKLFPESIFTGIFELYVKAFKEGGTIEKEFLIAHPSGHRSYQIRVSKIQTGILVNNKNITDMRSVEEQIRVQKEQLEFTYLASNDGYWDFNIKENKLFLSARWKTMLGYSEEELSNDDPQIWRKLVHPDDLRIALSAFRRHKNEETERFDKVLRYKKKDGEYIFIRSRALIIKDETGEPIRIVGTHTDTSTAKQAELALEKAKERAEKADKTKSEFLGMISHEMRTPLNGISGMAHLLEDLVKDPVQKEYLKDLIDSTEILSRLIDDLLQVVTLDSAKIEIREEVFALQTLVDMVRTLIEPSAKSKNISLQIFVSNKLPTRIVGDRTRIEQIILNLLINSVKFTEKGSVSLSIDLEGQNYIVFKIRDTGIGIKEEARQKIFEAFHQEDLADTRKYKGVGLGLYIAKRIVTLMKGDIRLYSEPGEGSEFTVLLPLKTEEEFTQKHPPKEQSLVPFFQSGSVLVVDDNEINLKILSKQISKTGLKTDAVLSGYEAVKLLESNERKYDLIFLDLQMPGMDGYHTADAIHALHSSNANVPIIAVTASSFSETYEKCAQHGIEGFIGKPFQPTQLYKVLTEFL